MKKILHINILGLILLTGYNSNSVSDTSSTTNNQNNIAEVNSIINLAIKSKVI